MITNMEHCVAFTGHRPNKLGNDYELVSPKVQWIKSCIVYEHRLGFSDRKPLRFIVGGALGIDTLAALIAIEYSVPFTLAIPCIGQELKWPVRSQQVYQYILSMANRVVYVSDKPYDNQCMQNRNIWMCDNAHELNGVWDGTSGGTKNCLDYAASIGLATKVLRI